MTILGENRVAIKSPKTIICLFWEIRGGLFLGKMFFSYSVTFKRKRGKRLTAYKG